MTHPAALAVTGAILFAVAIALAAVSDMATWKKTQRRVAIAGWVAFFAAVLAVIVAAWWAAS